MREGNTNSMRALVVVGIVTMFAATAAAHFQALIPSKDVVEAKDTKTVSLSATFTHPFEQHLMNMEKPVRFGVVTGGTTVDLLGTLKEKKTGEFSTWTTDYKIKRPGDHVFFVEPKPYWEPVEECFIVHYTKVVVNAMGLEEGWDAELGLKTEIVPLVRPYGLWTGNLFRGVVKLNGRPVPFAEIEVEYLNEGGKVKAISGPFVTQVIKADGNGVFAYSMPRAGWWAFAALSEDEKKMEHGGKEYPIEIGALMWVKVEDMR
ncbi:DUF4198 domain-containing protein [Planctomycetota bacterium]